MLVELVFIITVLAIILLLLQPNKTQKYLAWCAIGFSVPIAFSTGTRSLILMIIVFGLVLLVLFLLYSRASVQRKITFIVVTVIACAGLVSAMISELLIFRRFSDTIILFQNTSYFNFETIQILLGRDYTNTYADILDVGGFFGIGPFFVSTFRGSWMVYHNLYYHIVLSFGLTGLGIYLLFWGKLGKDLLHNISAQKSTIYSLLFALLITLLIDQIKIDYFRDSSPIQMYWLVYAIIALFNLDRFGEKTIIDNNQKVLS